MIQNKDCKDSCLLSLQPKDCLLCTTKFKKALLAAGQSGSCEVLFNPGADKESKRPLLVTVALLFLAVC